MTLVAMTNFRNSLMYFGDILVALVFGNFPNSRELTNLSFDAYECRGIFRKKYRGNRVISTRRAAKFGTTRKNRNYLTITLTLYKP